MPNFNVQDSAAQEKIRRGSHEFAIVDGRQTYVSKPYTHQEYPKIMDHTPAPQIAQFKGKGDAQAMLDQARVEWEAQIKSSLVHNKTEEVAWLKNNERRAS